MTVGVGVPLASHSSWNFSPSVYSDFASAILSGYRKWGFTAIKSDKLKISKIEVARPVIISRLTGVGGGRGERGLRRILGGLHGFPRERRGDQSSPTGYKGGGKGN